MGNIICGATVGAAAADDAAKVKMRANAFEALEFGEGLTYWARAL